MKRAILALSVLGLTACPQRTAIWLAGQAAPGRPIFGVGESYHGNSIIEGAFVVGPCAGFDGTWRTAVWVLGESEQGANRPLQDRGLSEITYGIAPVGYQVYHDSTARPPGVEAPPLGPGCYEVKGSGTGRLRIVVDSAGLVHEVRGAIKR